MTGQQALPLSGYAIEKVYSSELVFRDERPKESAEREIGFAWDWRMRGEDHFEVRIILSVGPTTERDEFVRVDVIGRFRRLGTEPTLPLEDFVRLQAPAILLPYARQLVSLLTGHGFFGSLYLPPLNVTRLMRGIDPAGAEGARQLAAAAGRRKKALSAGDVTKTAPRTRKTGRTKA